MITIIFEDFVTHYTLAVQKWNSFLRGKLYKKKQHYIKNKYDWPVLESLVLDVYSVYYLAVE